MSGGPLLRLPGGATFRLHGSAAATTARLWSPFAVDSAPQGATPLLAEDPATASAALNRAAIAACPLPAVHSAVVDLDGAAVAVPAVSGGGKSTLCTALCLAGAGYLSDEALILDAQGRAQPYPKPVALSRTSLAVLAPLGTPEVTENLDECLVAASELRPAAQTVPVRHVVLPVRENHLMGQAAQLIGIPRRDGLRALLSLGFNHYRDPRTFLTAAAAAVRGAEVWTVRYHDAPSAAQAIVDLLPGHRP